jgi:hypothetical protein
MRSPKLAAKPPAPARVRTSVVISAEALQRLRAAAVREGVDQSQIVEALVNRYLAGYVIQVRGDRFEINDRTNHAAGANPAGAATS